MITTAGPVRIQVPRDRGSSFEPKIVAKRRRRLGQLDEAILSLYARGMTTRDIRDHLAEIYDAEVSHETIANVTDVVADEVRSWQNRPVDEVYPILYVDAIRIKVRDAGTVVNKAAHLGVGVDVDVPIPNGSGYVCGGDGAHGSEGSFARLDKNRNPMWIAALTDSNRS